MRLTNRQQETTSPRGVYLHPFLYVLAFVLCYLYRQGTLSSSLSNYIYNTNTYSRIKNASDETLKETLNDPNATNNPTDHVETLPLDINGTIYSDIVSIAHVANESSVILHLRKNRTCNHPQLIGRLSGPLLTMIEWDTELMQQPASDSTDILMGHYHTPLPGK